MRLFGKTVERGRIFVCLSDDDEVGQRVRQGQGGQGQLPVDRLGRRHPADDRQDRRLRLHRRPDERRAARRSAKEGGGEVVHIPLVMGAVVPAYNLDEVKEPLNFTGPVLADIFLGKIKKWNDPALKELNPGRRPARQGDRRRHRSDGSGTTYIWVDYLAKVSPEWKKKVGVGTSVNWPVRRRPEGQRRRGRHGHGAPPAASATSS